MQLNSTMNVPAMQAQESKDFTTTKSIIKRIFNAYDASTTMTQTPLYSAYDADLTVDKNNVNYNYAVEIKERNVRCLEDLSELPLTCRKYCLIREKAVNKTPLVVYLVNGEKYYIFDLNKLSLSSCKMQMWEIKKVQYSNSEEMIKVPTLFIPLTESIYNGIILQTDAYNL